MSHKSHKKFELPENFFVVLGQMSGVPGSVVLESECSKLKNGSSQLVLSDLRIKIIFGVINPR